MKEKEFKRRYNILVQIGQIEAKIQKLEQTKRELQESLKGSREKPEITKEEFVKLATRKNPDLDPTAILKNQCEQEGVL